jgi:membrane-bound lytic murein transglycosylase B
MHRTRGGKLACAVVLWAAAVIGCATAASASGENGPLGQIRQMLKRQGVQEQAIRRAFDPPPELKLDTISSVIRIREAELDYDQYLQPWAMEMATEFLEKHNSLLQRAQKRYGVDPHTVTAILLVETRIGRYTGNTRVLDILTTLTLLGEQAYRERVWGMLSDEDKRELGRARTFERLERKAERGRKDLIALFKWYGDRPEEMASLKGSVMGAVGWPQFLPSSAMAYGVDGDGNGRLNLFDPADAVLSVANYLKTAGWEPSSPGAKEQAILRYNPSRPYMRTILELASRLRPS